MDYMNNVTYLTLEGHVYLQEYRYFYFVITLTVYTMIVCFNCTVIFVIYTNERLHEPMYVFIAALLCNALFGSAALYPKLLIDLLSECQTSSYPACLLQGFFLYTYGASEFTLLSAMAYDRYVSICKPLQYAMLFRTSTVRKMLFLSWFVPCCEISIPILLTSRLQLCRFRLNRIYCDNYSIVKLSCGDTLVNNMYGLINFSIVVFPPFFFVTFSYVRILTVCLRSSKDFRRKALRTCLPHLVIFINFSVNVCFEIINTRVESSRIPQIILMIMSVEYLVIPPLFNPVIYGLKMQEIFNSIKKLIGWEKRLQVSF